MDINDNSAKYIIINGSMYDSGESATDVLKNNGFCDISGSTVIYEVIRFIDGMPLFLEDHYMRFLKSASMLGDFELIPKSELLEYSKMLIKINGCENCNIKVMSILRNGDKTSPFAMYNSKAFYPPQSAYEEGVTVDCFDITRNMPNAKIRNEDYLAAIERMKNTSGRPLFEVLLVNESGRLTEGSKSNLFFVSGKKIITAPDEAVLKGVMRKQVIEICRETGIEIEFRAVHKDELPDIDAAFLTGTSIKALPINNIGSVRLASSANILVCKVMKFLDDRIEADVSAYR